MSAHLDAAKRALCDASGLETTDPRYQDLLVIAQVQARVAAADALTRLADHFTSSDRPTARTTPCTTCAGTDVPWRHDDGCPMLEPF